MSVNMTGQWLKRWSLAAVLVLILASCGGSTTEEGDGTTTAPGSESSFPSETTAASETTASSGVTEATEGSPFEGETIRLVVPYDAGGGFDTYARGVAPYLAEQLGADVAVENRPGAGGLLGANTVFQAEPDGLTIGLINYPGAVFAELTGQEGATFDNSQWTVLGRIAAVSPLIYAGADTGLTSIDDMVNSEEPIVFSLGGVGSDAYYGTVIIGNTFGFDYSLVTGYDGTAEQNAAILAGEADATFASVDSAQSFVEAGDGVPIVYVSNERAEDYPDVPTVIEAAGDDEDAVRIMESLAAVYSLERIIVAPPGTDEEVADALGEALAAAMNDPDFQADMEEQERSLNILDREGAANLIESAAAGLSDLEPLMEER